MDRKSSPSGFEGGLPVVILGGWLQIRRHQATV